MNVMRMKRPSPAFVVAMLALFVALGGTAGAVVTAAVPLAKRALTADKAKVALVADNAKKLGGQTSAQIVAQASARGAQQALAESPAGPRPSSTAAGLVTIKSQALGQIGAENGGRYTIACDAGQKVVGAGFSADNAVIVMGESYPLNDTTWQMILINLADVPANASAWATCLK